MADQQGKEMIHLKYFNAFVKIEGADRLQAKMISDLLSFEPEGIEHARRHMPPYLRDKWDGRKRLLDRRSMTFPSGLAPMVVQFLRAENVPYKVFEMRVKPTSTSKLPIIASLEPRSYQIEILELAKKISRGIIVVGTGGGKTISAGLMIANKGVDTLFVTPDTGLREQTLSVFRWLFGGDVVSSDVTSDEPIVVSNIQALASKEVKDLERFNMLIIDEFHHSASTQYQQLNHKTATAYYRYGLTGTPVRPDGNDMVMFGVLSSIIFKKTASDLIDEGWLVPPEITMVTHRLRGWSKLNYRQAYDRIIIDKDFNDIVASIANETIEANKQTIILVKRKDHGALLASLIPDAVYISGDDSLTHRDKMKEEFNNKTIRALIATSVMGEGQDIPNIDVLINARLQESEIQTKQGIGRALRLAQGSKTFEESVALGKDKCAVYDFLITGQRHLKAHSESRMHQYRSERSFRVIVK